VNLDWLVIVIGGWILLSTLVVAGYALVKALVVARAARERRRQVPLTREPSTARDGDD